MNIALTLTLEKVYLNLILSNNISMRKRTEIGNRLVSGKKILCLLRMTVEANNLWSLKWDFLRTPV